MNDDELRQWCETFSTGPHRSPVAVAVLAVLDDNARLRHALQSAATRIADQSEILSRRAERTIGDESPVELPGTHC